MNSSVFQLKAQPNCYDWGVVGAGSRVAQLALASPPFEIDPDSPYAELWMGTHPSGPSKILSTGADLKSHLTHNPRLLGESVQQYFGDDLPFLFKVLAVRKALSIQAHPDKMLAARLHKEYPDLYKDSNHKPEMAIALTPFRAFCGFLPLFEILDYLVAVPEFAGLVPTSIVASFQSAVQMTTDLDNQTADPQLKGNLKELFGAVMKAPSVSVQGVISAIANRYQHGQIHPTERNVFELFLELNSQYPGDVGVLAVYLLNSVVLEPGQALFLNANEPHAYISGDIIETMATSDNVVRAGLTPKFRDVDTLISMLTYSHKQASQILLHPLPFKSTAHTIIYNPPINEFFVLFTDLEPDQDEYFEGFSGPSVFIVVEGQGGVLESSGLVGVTHRFEQVGEVFFVGAGTPIKLKASSINRLVVYRASVEAPTM